MKYLECASSPGLSVCAEHLDLACRLKKMIFWLDFQDGMRFGGVSKGNDSVGMLYRMKVN